MQTDQISTYQCVHNGLLWLFAALLTLVTGCSFQIREQVILPAALSPLETDCGPRIPFDLCTEVSEVIQAQSTAARVENPEHASPQEPSGYQLLLTDYSVKEKAVSINRDATAAQYRVTARVTFQLRRHGQVLVEDSVFQKSTYHNDTANVLGKNREKAKMVRYLNSRIASEIPFRLAPYNEAKLNELLNPPFSRQP